MQTPASRPSYRRTGQAMIEYLVVIVAVALLLFIPSELTGNMAPAAYLARAVRAFFRAYSFTLSVY